MEATRQYFSRLVINLSSRRYRVTTYDDTCWCAWGSCASSHCFDGKCWSYNATEKCFHVANIGCGNCASQIYRSMATTPIMLAIRLAPPVFDRAQFDSPLASTAIKTRVCLCCSEGLVYANCDHIRHPYVCDQPECTARIWRLVHTVYELFAVKNCPALVADVKVLIASHVIFMSRADLLRQRGTFLAN